MSTRPPSVAPVRRLRGVGEQANADLARRGFELWNERRIDDLLLLFHEEAVWDMRPFGIPDMAAAFEGHEGIRRFFSEWLEAFPDSSIAVEEVEQRGEWTLTFVLQMVSGGTSGTPVPFHYAGIGHWRDGRLDLVENHSDLDAAGLAFRSYAGPD
jgi:ketosteroid isomerase-like protein